MVCISCKSISEKNNKDYYFNYPTNNIIYLSQINHKIDLLNLCDKCYKNDFMSRKIIKLSNEELQLHKKYLKSDLQKNNYN